MATTSEATPLPSIASGETIGAVALLEESEVLASRRRRSRRRRDGDGFKLTAPSPSYLTSASPPSSSSPSAPNGVRLAVVPSGAAGLTAKPYMTMDQTKRMGDLEFQDVSVPGTDVLSADDSALVRLLDLGAVAVTAESVGMSRAHEITTQYAKDRIQFGAPIGKYQASSTRLPRCSLTSRPAAPSSTTPPGVTESPDEPARLRAPRLTPATLQAPGVDCVQLHGAIGFTWEYDIQLYLKRSKWAFNAYGEPDHHYERVAAIGGY